MALESSEQPPSKEGGAPTSAVASANPEAPNTLVEALRRASIMEEHRTPMGAVVEKCRISGSGKTLKVRTMGCARRSPPTESRPQPRRDL